MKNKYVWWIAIAVIVILLVIGGYKIATAQEVLSCPTGQIVGSVLVTPEVPGTPAVTHVVHHDTTYKLVCPTSDSAYTSHDDDKPCSRHFFYGWRYANKVSVVDVEAWDETVIDVEAVPAVPAVYEDQCVTDPGYVAPEPTPAPAPAPSSPSGGGRHPYQLSDGTWYCPSPLNAANDPFNHCPHVGSNLSLQQQLINLLNQLIVLLQQQIALQ